MRVFIDSYGCTFNQADAQAIRSILRSAGFELSDLRAADAVVLNTCAAKNATESRMFSRIEKYAAAGKKVVVAGCLPRINPQRLSRYSVGVVDSDSVLRLPEALTAAEPQQFFSTQRLARLRLLEDGRGSQTAEAVVVPIASGCLSRCAYCAVKNARGVLASYPPDEIACFISRLSAAGRRLFLLTSQDSACYGLDLGTNLAELLNRITALEGGFQVRVGMMNPEHAYRILDGLVTAFRSPRVVKFLHLPLQSGSDRVLREMRRNYSVSQFCEIVQKFRNEIPEVFVSTDVIVGFPTETEQDFQQTLQLVEQTRPGRVNISKYYPRPNTPAARLQPLPTQVLKDRSKRLAELCERLKTGSAVI